MGIDTKTITQNNKRMEQTTKAKNNRTLELVEEEIPSLRERLLTEEKIKSLAGEASVLKNEQFINKKYCILSRIWFRINKYTFNNCAFI